MIGLVATPLCIAHGKEDVVCLAILAYAQLAFWSTTGIAIASFGLSKRSA